MFHLTEIDCAALVKIGDRFLDVGEFHSVFFRPEVFSATYPEFGRGVQAVLSDVLRSSFLGAVVPQLVPLDFKAAMKFAVLNRYEFEGSLIGALLQGTCTASVVDDERDAREKVRIILDGALLKPDGALFAFRMDDPSWSALTSGATFSWAYFVYEASQKLWWFVCFADYY